MALSKNLREEQYWLRLPITRFDEELAGRLKKGWVAYPSTLVIEEGMGRVLLRRYHIEHEEPLNKP